MGVRLSSMAPNYFFLMNDKRSSEKPIVPPDKSSEFERNLFTSCLQGLTESISTDVVLSKKLADLEAEVLKGESISSPIDLGKEIVKLNSIFIEEIKKIRESSRTLQDELEDQRRTSITLAEKLEQSQAQALVDPLTKVLNRAAYNMRIGQMVQEYKRYKEEWALLTLDIDHFKKFNDEFGHQLGDNVLKSVAGTVKNCIRVSDRVFRYGGEEFVVLLGRINSEIATHLAEKICQAVEGSFFVHCDQKLKVTVSIGGAIIDADDDELSIFEKADKAMYQAKNNGRNQVVMDL